MRNVALVLGVVVAGCSVDHVVVAALDTPNIAGEAGGGDTSVFAETAGSTSAQGGSGASSGAGEAGEPSQGLAGMGGAGAGDVNSREFCACLSNETQFCGSDGMTYPASCEDGAVCFPPAVACLHACPCLGNEPDVGVMTSLSPGDCAPTTPCSGDKVCWFLSQAEADQQPRCPSGSN